MGAGTELLDLKTNLKDTRKNLNEVKNEVRDLERTVKDARKALEYVQKIEDQADSFGQQVNTMLLTLKVMDKAGPFKLIAKVATAVLNKVKSVAEKIEEKAKSLNQKIEDGDYIQKLKNAENKLDDIKDSLIDARDKVDEYKDHTEELIDTLDQVDDLDGPNNDVLGPFSDTIDDFVEPVNDILEGINGTYEDIKTGINTFQTGFHLSTFNPILTVASQFSSITSSLSFLKKPLEIVYSALKPIEPILNVVGFIFSITVEPVLNFILEKTGINSLLDKLADKIASALPKPDALNFSDLNLDNAFDSLGNFGVIDALSGWDFDLQGMLDDLLDDVLSSFGDEATDVVYVGTKGDDELVGTNSADVLNGRAGNDTITASAGDDVIFATRDDDTIYGGAGVDRMKFRGDFSEYTFSQSGENGPLVFYHDSPASTRTNGFEVVYDVEEFFFRDGKFSKTDLLENVYIANGPSLEGSTGNDFLYAKTSSVTIVGLDGDDRFTGSDFSDTMYGGDGDDIFTTNNGSDTVYGGDHAGTYDTWVYANNPGSNSLTRIDLETGTVTDGDSTDYLFGIENIRMQDSRDTEITGNADRNRIVANGGRDWIDGKAGHDKIFGGDGRDLLIGGRGKDSVFGGADFDKLVAGGSVVNGQGDYYDGGEGTDVLSYSTQFQYYDFEPEHSNSIDSQEATDSLRIYTRTGTIERLNAAGTNVKATDTAINIERFIGSDSTDTIYGWSSYDDRYISIDGGGGDDILYSNGARDTAGGTGNDTMYVTLPPKLYNNMSFDGNEGIDTLDTRLLDDMRFSLRLSGAIGSSFRGYDASTSDGLNTTGTTGVNGGGRGFFGNYHDIEIAHLGEFNDEVYLEGSDRVTVYGHGGDDSLIRETSNDGSSHGVLYGGQGNDYLRLRLEGSIYGGADDDELYVKASGNEHVVKGGSGDDIITVGRMDGEINGGSGYDRLVMEVSTHVSAAPSTFIDLQSGIVEVFGGSGDIDATVIGIEELIGADNKTDRFYGRGGDERMLGRGANDTLDGRSGDDQLFGGFGNDSLFGGSGDDLLHGGGGSDVLNGGSGTDTASYATAAPNTETGEIAAGNFGGVFIYLDGSSTNYGAQGYDTLIDIENLVGSTGNDHLVGNNGQNALSGGDGNDTLNGQGGKDVLIGGAGNDTLFGGAGSDTMIFGLGVGHYDGGAGMDTLDLGQADGSLTVDFNGLVTGADIYISGLLNIDIPVWADDGSTGARAFDGQMLTPQDVLEAQEQFANSFDDLTRTLPDSDDPEAPLFEIKLADSTLYSSGEATSVHQIIGGTAANLIIASQGIDRFDGSLGNFDRLDLSMFNSSVTYDLETGATNKARFNNDVLIDIDELLGSAYADTLWGDDGINVLIGGAGADKLYGRKGKDELEGGGGADRIWGGDKSDTLRGDNGDDKLYGGAGADYMIGGYGNDTLTGGKADDELRGNRGLDTLFGGDGNDSLTGGRDQDILTGGANADTFIYENTSDSDNSSDADIITDFGVGGDTIDLSALVGGTFSFIGNDSFSAFGPEVNARVVAGDTIMRLDVDGDGDADMRIVLTGYTGLSVDDLIL